MSLKDHAISDPASPFAVTLEIGNATFEYRPGAALFTFTDTAGMTRKLDDEAGQVAKLLEVILEGSPEPVAAVVSTEPAWIG